jgi:riboflavin-specific deaminase-like protein
LRRLLPEQQEVTLEQAYASLRLDEHVRPDRPYVVANMVATADGRATLAGSTRAISSDADRALFHSLREQVDAVMAGTATIALERYGRLVRDPERVRRRVERELEPLPLAVTASRSLELPAEAPLFQDPDSRIVVLTGSVTEAPSCGAELMIEHMPADGGHEIDLARGMQLLRERYAVRTLLLEGGPTLLAAMMQAGVVDELFLAIAPLAVGSGSEPAIVEGEPLPEPVSLSLVGVLEDEGFLFLRYEIGGSGR